MSEYRYMRSRSGVFGVGALIALGIIACGGWVLTWESTSRTETCTVQSKDRTAGSNGNSNQRVYTKDCGIVQVADDFPHLTFNSSDTYALIQEGKTYRLTTLGWRNGFLSVFPNVIEATPVSK